MSKYKYSGRPKRITIIVSDGDELELSSSKNKLRAGFTEVLDNGRNTSGNSKQGAKAVRGARVRAVSGSDKE